MYLYLNIYIYMITQAAESPLIHPTLKRQVMLWALWALMQRPAPCFCQGQHLWTCAKFRS